MLTDQKPERGVTVDFGQKPFDRYASVDYEEAHRARSRRISSELSPTLRPANSSQTCLTFA